MKARLLVLIALLMSAFLGSAAAATAVNVDGNWKGAWETPMGSMDVSFSFKVDGETLTGTMSNDMMGQNKISAGTLKGDDIYFEVVVEGQMGTMKMIYKGKVAGDEMKVAVQIGDFGSQEMVLKRVK